MQNRLRPTLASLVLLILATGLVDSVSAARPAARNDTCTSAPLHVASPDWRDQIIYFAMIDRFDNADSRNDDQGAEEFDPTDGRRYSGGDLAGLSRRLDYFHDLGATALWITPPVANQWWDARHQYGGYHGYWAEDFMRVDAHAGTLDDYRKQVTATVDLDLLGHCADRYGVSLTAATLKWLQYTDEKAVLVMSNDGFINWAWSSEPTAKAGAFFRTRNNVIPVLDGALAANADIKHDRPGTQVPASIWFPHARADTPLREMKVHAEQYGVVLSLLHLPRSADVWPPWAEKER